MNLYQDMINSLPEDERPKLIGIRDNNLLKSALNSPFQTFDGIELYPHVFNKATILLFSLIKNHPFLDGNKRFALVYTLLYLMKNNYVAMLDNIVQNDLDNLKLGSIVENIAKNNYTKEEFFDFLSKNFKPTFNQIASDSKMIQSIVRQMPETMKKLA